MIDAANGTASTTLTVTTSASVPRYGLLMPDLISPWALLLALALFSLVMRRGGKLRTGSASLLTTTAAAPNKTIPANTIQRFIDIAV